MKKFISFVMAGAMVASLVPATAFAKGEVTATAKIVDAEELTKDEAKDSITKADAPELQLKITGVDYKKSDSSDYKDYEHEIEVTLDNAEFTSEPSMGIRLDDSTGYTVSNGGTVVSRNKGGTIDAGAVKAATDALDAWFMAAGTATVGDLDSVSSIESGTATGGTAKKLAEAEATLAAAKSAAESGATTEKGNLTTAQDALKDAKNVVTVAEAAVSVKQKAVDTAYDEMGANPTDSTKVTAWENAKTELATAQANLTAAQNKLAEDLPGLEEDVADAQKAYDEKINTPVVAAAQKDVDSAKATNEEAKAEYKAAYDAYKNASTSVGAGVVMEIKTEWDKNDPETATFTVFGKLHEDDVLYVDLASKLTKTSEGTKATVSVDSKAVVANDLVFASVLGQGFKVSVKKTADIAEEEKVQLHSNGLKIESAVGNFKPNSEITLKISKGFEFVKNNNNESYDVTTGFTVDDTEDNELTVKVGSSTHEDELTIKNIWIEAVSAKSGAIATITAKASNMDSASCEVAKVVDYKVALSVDEDEDVPVIYSGVDAENKGITDDSDHLSLEVTVEETFPGAWSMRQGFDFNLPEGVYVTDVKNIDAEHFYQNGKELGTPGQPSNEEAWTAAFFNAYQDGDHKNFEFDKRVFDDVNTTLTKDPAKVTFQLELVADPTFEGDVKLAFEGSLVDKQEVTIAKFVKPYTVKAEQNDVIIDYRNTEIKTPIVVTEAEEGLWEEGAEFKFTIDKEDLVQFEDDATFEIDKDSELDVKDDTKKGTLTFTVKEESDAAATVTIKDMKLFMQRNIPAGAYDLEVGSSLATAYEAQRLFAADHDELKSDNTITVKDCGVFDSTDHNKTDKDCFVGDVCDYTEVVKEAFVNVVTGGRDQDNLFTTKVVVPVGESYMVAGENKVELDVAAYISEAGYTMLPVRAISKALGVNTNNVLWNADARTVTIMYGQRIITMTVGQKTIYVNGSAVPASAAPEIKDGRTFLPLRDLGTALGVTDVSWDAATKTATMNGGK